MKRTIAIVIVFLCIPPLYSAKINYCERMRELVINISKEAKKHNPEFIIIGQNALELLTINGKPTGKHANNYCDAMDAIGIEELFWGYHKQGVQTPMKITHYYLSYLAIFNNYKKPVLVIDYVNNEKQAYHSFIQSSQRGFLSFQTNLQCSIIPQWMHNKNEDAVRELSHAKNFLYFINPQNHATMDSFINTVASTWYDVIIVDAFFWGIPLTKDDVHRLQKKPNGARRLVIAYMSVGEAEDYRYYWKAGWEKLKPQFLEQENKLWKGNYKVRYWDTQWHEILYGNGNEELFGDSYLGRVIAAGFDGVYMDVLDAALYFQEKK